jgi:hypothetical protein
MSRDIGKNGNFFKASKSHKESRRGPITKEILEEGPGEKFIKNRTPVCGHSDRTAEAYQTGRENVTLKANRLVG